MSKETVTNELHKKSKSFAHTKFELNLATLFSNEDKGEFNRIRGMWEGNGRIRRTGKKNKRIND